MPIFEWRLDNILDDEEGDTVEKINVFEVAHIPLIEEEIVYYVDIVENEVGEYRWTKLRMW